MELTITEQETYQIDELFSTLETVIMKIILVGADTLEITDFEELKSFISTIEKLNLKYLTEKTNELLELIREPKKNWTREEREQLALITSMLHQTVITIKSKFVKQHEFSRKEKQNLNRPVNVKQVPALDFIPLEIQGIGRTSYGSGKYYGSLYQLKGINLETKEFITIIDHSQLQASSMNSRWFSSLANDTLYLNKLIGNKITFYNLVAEGVTVFRKAPKTKKKADITELSTQEREVLLTNYNEIDPNSSLSLTTIKKFIYDPTSDAPFYIQPADDEEPVRIISFNKNIFYYMFFNDKKNVQLLKYGDSQILFENGDAFITDLPLSLPITIWNWDKVIPYWIKNKQESLTLLNLEHANILKGKSKILVKEHLVDYKTSKAVVKKDLLKFLVLRELDHLRPSQIVPELDWKALIKEQSSLEHLLTSKKWDPQLAALLIFASKNKSTLKFLIKKKKSIWQQNYIENLMNKQGSKEFSNFVIQRIKANAPPKEIVLLLVLHLLAFDFLTEDIVRILKGSAALERSNKLDFYMDSNPDNRFWLSCVPLFIQTKKIESWDRVMFKWVMDSLSPTECRHLAFANVVSLKTKKQLIAKSKNGEISSRDPLAVFIQEQLMKIGVEYLEKPQIDWKKEIEPFKDVKNAQTSVTDNLASLMIYKNGKSDLAIEYEDKKKLYWGFLLIKELLTKKNESEVNRLVGRLVSSSPKNTAFVWAVLKDAFKNIPKEILRTLNKSQSFILARKMETYLNFSGMDRFYYSCLAVVAEKEMKKI